MEETISKDLGVKKLSEIEEKKNRMVNTWIYTAGINKCYSWRG